MTALAVQPQRVEGAGNVGALVVDAHFRPDAMPAGGNLGAPAEVMLQLGRRLGRQLALEQVRLNGGVELCAERGGVRALGFPQVKDGALLRGLAAALDE